jgi:predicted nucleotide-binding protein (sugar kinase/HSP70/actin superfamily)
MASPTVARNSLQGRTLYLPRMCPIGVELLAAAFRAVGTEARVLPPADPQVYGVAAAFANFDECLPFQITLGSFLSALRKPGSDPAGMALFMLTTSGPCRFGQYAPVMRMALKNLGYPDVPIISSSSSDGYEDISQCGKGLMKVAWLAVIVGDLLRQLLLSVRPLERCRGDADEACRISLDQLTREIERTGVTLRQRRARLKSALEDVRKRFRAIPLQQDRDRLLIGVVGEIFCRMDVFANQELIRRVEEKGGMVWISNASEWLLYTHWLSAQRVSEHRSRFLTRVLAKELGQWYLHHSLHRWQRMFQDDLQRFPEPENLVADILQPAQPYLPAHACIGESMLSVGKAIYMQKHGVCGVLDVSPFGCMHGVLAESQYAAVSRNHERIPIQSIWLDGACQRNEDKLDLFMMLSEEYRSNRRTPLPKAVR